MDNVSENLGDLECELEFKKGDFIVFTWGDKQVRKIELNLNLESCIVYNYHCWGS